MAISTNYAKLTGTPREKTIFDWKRHEWREVIAIDLGRPDPIIPFLELWVFPEKMPAGKEPKKVDKKGDGFYTIVKLLQKRGAMRIRDLCRVTGYGKGRVHNILWRNSKYFEKVRDEKDGRVVLYSLSHDGLLLEL